MTGNALNKQVLLQSGKYRIIRVLGQGGFGITYLAEQNMLKIRVAIKEFFIKGVTQRDAHKTTVSVSNAENKTLFLEQLQKFKKEARRISILKNPYIVTVFDLFEENGTAYYVMNYIDGENLAEKLKRLQQPLSETEMMGYLYQILDALDCVHQEGIWHLDLKPANIMVDRQGNVTLIDFGASKQSSNTGGATMSTAVSYTNGFAPREQMEQNLEKFGPWTDLYALGATLYNLLSNKKPPMPSDIDDDNSTDKRIALPFPAGLSKKARKLILWLMNTDRHNRPQSVEQVRRHLQEDDNEHKKTEQLEMDEETMVMEKSGLDQKPPKAEMETTEIIENEDNLNSSVGGIQFKPSYSFALRTSGNTIIDRLVANMVHVAGGTFTMGATLVQGSDAKSDEKPYHKVKLSSFFIGRYEVTQEEWRFVMGSNPSTFKGDKRPVENVSWDDCQKFINKLNAITGKQFRLPSEAEWEFAAHGGNSCLGYKYSGGNSIDSVAWFEGNSYNETHSVGQKQPNELGLYDMSGNVWEWCSDWYGNYSSLSQSNPIGASSGSRLVRRGGSWRSTARECRISNRSNSAPDNSYSSLGLRLAL